MPNTIAAFADDLSAHRGDPEAIDEVCLDMSPAFVKGVTASLPNAAITFDKFHAVKIINDAVDQVRRANRRGKACCAALAIFGCATQPTCPTGNRADPGKSSDASSQDRTGLPDTARLPGPL